jgi:hypothetical protein
MNTNKKIFIVNNQEDEDGDNLYSGNAAIHKNIKREWGIYSTVHTQNKKNNVITLTSHRLFVPAGTPAVKSK